MDEPRADVPVGALWVQGYGPSGEGASTDNLVTTRSLSGFTLAGDLQFGLNVGISNILHIDPTFRNKINAHFGDLSIVRVKNVSRLSGPAGEPRIYEALRAGTITVTAEHDIGINLDSNARTNNVSIIGHGDTGRTQSITIDGRDMFIAYRVVIPREARSAEQSARLRPAGDGAEVVLHGYRLHVSAATQAGCTHWQGATLEPTRGVVAPGSGARPVPAAHPTPVGPTGLVTLPLPVPLSDGHDGLYTSIAISGLAASPSNAAGAAAAARCLSPGALAERVSAVLVGTRLEEVGRPSARTW